MNESIVKKLALEYETDEEAVQKEMREALEHAAKNPTPLWILLFGENRIPDTNEFCKVICEMISA